MGNITDGFFPEGTYVKVVVENIHHAYRVGEVVRVISHESNTYYRCVRDSDIDPMYTSQLLVPKEVVLYKRPSWRT